MRRTFFPLLLVASMVLPAMPAQAAPFNPQFIMSDAEMRDVNAMSFSDIYKFLDSKGGMNSIVVATPDYCDKGKPAGYDPLKDSVPMVKGPAQMIYDAAHCYGINPKYILALLQKESAIVETKKPTQKQMDWAAGYALCDGCRKTSAMAKKYKGLGKQIDIGAGWMDWFFENAPTFAAASTTSYKLPGKTYRISGQEITPMNLTTAALYSYTPHVGNDRVGGNKSLWRIWQRWWGSSYALDLPEGSLIRNMDTGGVALVQNGVYRPIMSASVLATRFASANIIDMTPEDFNAFLAQKPGAPVRFPDQSLVRTETGEIYLLIGDTKRLIPSPEIFRDIGFNPEEVEIATAADIADYRLGAPVTLDDAFPGGALLQDKATGGVFYAEGGQKHPILDRGVLLADFPGKSIVLMSSVELEKIPSGDPVRLNDGVLVKGSSDSAVYVIAGGQKRPIPNEEIFLGYGYRFSSVVTVSQKTLDLHPTGVPLQLIPIVPPPTDAAPSASAQI